MAFLTVGDLSRRFGLRDWHIRAVIKRGLIPAPPRVGQYRVFTPDQLPGIEQALRAAGYLRAEEPAHA
ncbi:MAG: hypothetical protein JNM56_23770 [Planctomycetia bacterium]|nr:hypothetical protein [Planctomycetia bacterium]